MCVTCGCSDDAEATVTRLGDPHGHDEHEHVHADGTRHRHRHGLDGSHEHAHDAPRSSETVRLETAILAKNDLIAARNRGWFEGRGILALNLVSAPGAGKTTLLERTICDLGGRLPIAVIEGDQATDRDAARIRATGCEVVQINTGAGCHLEADMVARGLDALQPPTGSVLMIENVGNLVCPALFDLGEHGKVVLLSVAEGDDKPLKYPHMFRAAAAMVVTKLDLLPHVRFDLDRCIAEARALNPRLVVFTVSAYTGAGLADWYAWLVDGVGLSTAATAAPAGPSGSGANEP
jgi:hydrogenase nickel incorporation protein HypB